MEIQESIVMVPEYKPALAFAASAMRWRKEVRGSTLHELADEPALLTLLYASFALEAIITEFLDTRLKGATLDELLDPKTTVQCRWSKGARLLSRGTPASLLAVDELNVHCRDAGTYGLLVRSRNKLVHPLVYTEVIDSSGHRILDRKVDGLMQALARPPVSLPCLRPAFPNMLKTVASADWAVDTMATMVRGLHKVVEEPLNEDWQKALAEK